MMVNIMLLVVGAILLWLAGESVIRGSASFARRHGVSQLVIGLTVVALGTSAPELFVSVMAAWQGNADIAIGNVVGSNIANLGLVLGLTAVLQPIIIKKSLLKIEIPILIIVSGALIIFSLNASLVRWHGLIFLIGLIIFLRFCLLKTEATSYTASSEPPSALKKPWQEWILMLLGFIGLLLGSKFFVAGAVGTARIFGISEFFIGLSVVALGTSLPELAASLIAVVRKHHDLAIGNLIGSNIMNILLILGITSVIQPIKIPSMAMQFDYWFMLFLTFILLPVALSQRKIARWEGTIFLASYVYYIIAIALRG